MKRSLIFSLCLISVSLQARATDPLVERLKGPTSGAHRGGMAYARAGNTIERFQYALSAGIDVIELDLHISKDGVPVVIHSDFLESSTLCRGPIHDHTWEELKSCRVKFTQQYIPSLEEVLLWNNGRVVLNAEFKEAAVIIPALELVKKHGAYESIFFQTRNEREMYTTARNHDSQVGLLYKILNFEDLKWAAELQDPRLVVIEIDKDMVRKEVIDAIHAADKLVLANSFRFDTFREFLGANCKLLFDLGVDIAISDNPKSCVAQKKEVKSGEPLMAVPVQSNSER
jgi:glycerophosphoryl diester phosphodiesterase